MFKKDLSESDLEANHYNVKDYRYPTYLLDDEWIPCGFSSFFYILPRATWECLFATAFITPLHPNNDLYMAYLMQACGFAKIKHNGVFDCKIISLPMPFVF